MEEDDKKISSGRFFQDSKKIISNRSKADEIKKQPSKSRHRRYNRIINSSDLCLDFIEDSVDADSIEEEYRAKREALKRERRGHANIAEDTITVQTESESETLSEDSCSENNTLCSFANLIAQSSKQNPCNERKKSIVCFTSSTPTRYVTVSRQHCVRELKLEETMRQSESVNDHKFSTPNPPKPDDLPCFLSPILSMTGRLSLKCGQKEDDSVSSLESFNLSSKQDDNQMHVRNQNKILKAFNLGPSIVKKIPVHSFTDANQENSTAVATGEAVESCLKKYNEYLPQSPDPFADSDVLHKELQSCNSEKVPVAKYETQLTNVCDETEQSNNTFESDQRNVNLLSPCNSVRDETAQQSSSCISDIKDGLDCIGVVNSSQKNYEHVQTTGSSQTAGNICYRKCCRASSLISERNQNQTMTINDSTEQSMAIDTSKSSNSSLTHVKLNTSGNVSESIELASQNHQILPYQEMSKISLSESRNSCRKQEIKRKSISSRRSHLVVPLAYCELKNYERNSYFREVYISSPSQKRFMNRKSSLCQLEDKTSRSLEEEEENGRVMLDEEQKDGKTFKDVVLELCGQTDVLIFDDAFADCDLTDCKKIGEGVYGEVFARTNSQGQNLVMKILPIEGDCQINGESQKSYEEILPEIVISEQLSNLRDNEDFKTSNFPQLVDCWCVQGRYPSRLLKLWHEYNEEKTSENDSPEILPEDQIYIVLELNNVGSALESFVFNSAEQSWSAFLQIAHALAVAEAYLEFEHRDLHWGNILIKKTTDKTMKYRLYGEDLVIPTQGIQASVIDFTLSRITYDGCCLFINLADDPALFEGEGDYQFDIYRMMRDKVENNWQMFEPYNNVLWLSYMLEKLITQAYYRNVKTKTHKRGIAKLEEMKSRILDFKSATEVALSFS